MAKSRKKKGNPKQDRCPKGSRRLPEKIGRCVSYSPPGSYLPPGSPGEIPDYFDTPDSMIENNTVEPTFFTPPPTVKNSNNYSVVEENSVLTNTTNPTEEPSEKVQLFESPIQSINSPISSIESSIPSISDKPTSNKIYFYNERKNPKNSKEYNNQTSSIFKTRIEQTNPYEKRSYLQHSGRDYTTKDFSFLEKSNEMKNENGESVKSGYLYIISKILGKHLFFKVGISGASITSTTGLNRLSNAQTFLVPGLKENAGFQIHFVFFFEMKDDAQIDREVKPLIKKIESRVHTQLRTTFSEATIMHSSGDRASEWFLVPRDEVEIFLGFVIDMVASTRVKPLEIQKYTKTGIDNSLELPDDYKDRLKTFGVSEQTIHSQRIEADLDMEYVVQLNGVDKKGTLDLYNKEFFQNENKQFVRCFFPITDNIYIELYDLIEPSSNKNPELEANRFYAFVGIYAEDVFPFEKRRVRKMFHDTNWYEGTVLKYSHVDSTSKQSIRKVWTIKYDDGQEEDSYLTELLDIMIPQNKESTIDFSDVFRELNITTIQPDKSGSYVLISISDFLELLRRFKISDNDYNTWALKTNYEYYMSIKNGEFVSRIEVSTKAYVVPQWYHDKQIQLFWAQYLKENSTTFYDGENVHWKVNDYEQEFSERGRYIIECIENVFNADGEEINTQNRKKESFHVLRVMMWINANLIMREFEDRFINLDRIMINKTTYAKVNDSIFISTSYFGSYNKFGYTNNVSGKQADKIEYHIERMFEWNNRHWLEVMNSSNDRETFFILMDDRSISQKFFTKKQITEEFRELGEPVLFKDEWMFSGNSRFKKGDIIRLDSTKYNENPSFQSRSIGIPHYKQGEKNVIEFMKIHGDPEIGKGRYKIQYLPPYDKLKTWKKQTTKRSIYYEYHPIEKVDLFGDLQMIRTRSSSSKENALEAYKHTLREMNKSARTTKRKTKTQSSLNITKKK